MTTIDLGSAGPVFGERLATVYYPADPDTVAGHPPFSYTEASTLPAALQGILPAKYNTTTTLAAYSEAPASTKGPYPVVLFSHGYGGERLYYSNLLVGIASWGYVVVSADYLERGLAAQALGSKGKPTAADDSADHAVFARRHHAGLVRRRPRSSTASPTPTGSPRSATPPAVKPRSTH